MSSFRSNQTSPPPLLLASFYEKEREESQTLKYFLFSEMETGPGGEIEVKSSESRRDPKSIQRLYWLLLAAGNG